MIRKLKLENNLKQCICIYEPRGDYGLEGFELKTVYNCERMNNYYRIYLQNDYYETCSIKVFNKYFKLL